MKQSLKDLGLAGGIPLEKVQSLLDLVGGDEQWIESVLRGASKAEKAAMLAGVAFKYKADDAGGLDPLDQAYVQLRDALDAGDQAGVQQALAQLAELAQSPPPTSTPKARVLTDIGDQSAMPTAAKSTSRDLWAAAFGADQQRAALTVKAYDPSRDLWAAAFGSDQVAK